MQAGRQTATYRNPGRATRIQADIHTGIRTGIHTYIHTAGRTRKHGMQAYTYTHTYMMADTQA